MAKRNASPVHSGRVALVVELEIEAKSPPSWARLLTSIPGRESTFSRVIPLPTGRLENDVYVDLCTHIEQHILTALECVGGVQMSLDL